VAILHHLKPSFRASLPINTLRHPNEGSVAVVAFKKKAGRKIFAFKEQITVTSILVLLALLS
jgi:hypothetical protein